MTAARTWKDSDSAMVSPGEKVDGRGAWLRCLAGILISPRVSFSIIRQQQPWIGVLLVVSLANVVQVLALRPYILEASFTTFGGANERLEQVASVMFSVGLALAPVLLLFTWLLQALMIWLLTVAFGGDARFGQTLSLAAHLGVISFIGGLVPFLVLMLRGLEAIRTPSELAAAPSLNLLLSSDSIALSAVYANITPITIWYTVLLGLGVSAVFRLSRQRALAVAVAYWAAATALVAARSTVVEILTPT